MLYIQVDPEEINLVSEVYDKMSIILKQQIRNNIEFLCITFNVLVPKQILESFLLYYLNYIIQPLK